MLDGLFRVAATGIASQSYSGRRQVVYLLVLVIFFLFLPRISRASDYPDSIQVSSILKIQALLYDDRFIEADQVALGLSDQFPDDPSGDLFRAIGLLAHMCDAEENLFDSLFHALISSAFVKANKSLEKAKQNDKTAWMYLYRGHTRAYGALWEARFGSTLAAIKGGRAARAEYVRGLESDSTIYDLYFGLGLYHYWKSARAGVLRWIGIVSNDREKGITQLRLAADSAIISGPAARSSLIWIWLDRKEYDSVIAEAQVMAQAYPHGKSFLWPWGDALRREAEFDRAAIVYRRLRDLLAKNPANYYNVIECDYWLYRCCDRLGLEEEKARVAKRFGLYALDIPRETANRQRVKISYLKRRAR